ncbi:MAG: hypothetical protein PW786_14675 [Arachidicoccus sp.]|nr:hypothetical protein [Arachidicoccus sp.]
MDSLWNVHQTKNLNDTMYLKAVNQIADEGYGLPRFSESLLHFRDLAFADKKPNMYKVMYYNYLATDADINDQAGRCIFFEEKQVAEYKKVKTKDIEDFVLPVYLINYYKSAERYDMSLDEYRKILPDVKREPSLIVHDSAEAVSAESALKAIYYIMPALERSMDTAVIRLSYTLAQNIFDATQHKKQKAYIKRLPGLRFCFYFIQFYYHICLYTAKPLLAKRDIQMMCSNLLAKDYVSSRTLYPATYLLEEIYMSVADYYFSDRHNSDSTLALSATL